MHDKDKVISDKKLPYEYNICLYILEELCDKGIIDVKAVTRERSSGVMRHIVMLAQINRFKIDKSQPYEHNITIIIFGELCNEGTIDIFDIVKTLTKLRKLYNLPVIDIYGKKESNSCN